MLISTSFTLIVTDMAEVEIRQPQKRRRTEGDAQSQMIFGIYKTTPPTSSSTPSETSTALTPIIKEVVTNSQQSTSHSQPSLATSTSGDFGGSILTEKKSTVGIQYAMLPVAFRMLLQMKGSQLLLIDCRDAGSFSEKQINSARCINVPIYGDIDFSGEPRFTSKTAVVGFLQEHCPELLLHLYAPNHFANVVIIDELSSVQACSASVKLLVEAILKWNETTKTTTSTKTSVHVLQGGFQSLSKAFPHLIVASAELFGAVDAQEIGQTVNYADLITPDCPKEFTESLICYLKDHDESIDIIRRIINFRRRIKPLNAIKSVLLLELAVEEVRLNKQLDDLIPDDLKCPICFEIFRGEIFQCENGHSICSMCCQNLPRCPECRTVYFGRVRNRALENLLRNALKVECLCGEKLELNQVPDHVTECVKRRIGVELIKLENEIEVTKQEIEEMNLKLGNVNKIITDTELLWGSKFEEGQIDQLSPVIWKRFSDYMSVKKSTICLLNKALFAMVFGSEGR